MVVKSIMSIYYPEKSEEAQRLKETPNGHICCVADDMEEAFSLLQQENHGGRGTLHGLEKTPGVGAANGGADLVQVRRDEGEQPYLQQHEMRRKALCELSGEPSVKVAQPSDSG